MHGSFITAKGGSMIPNGERRQYVQPPSDAFSKGQASLESRPLTSAAGQLVNYSHQSNISQSSGNICKQADGLVSACQAAPLINLTVSYAESVKNVHLLTLLTLFGTLLETSQQSLARTPVPLATLCANGAGSQIVDRPSTPASSTRLAINRHIRFLFYCTIYSSLV
jgi:hypothetical protein